MCAKKVKAEVENNGIGGMTQATNTEESLSGAAMVVRALEDQGVDTVFGFPGGQVLPLYDALYDSKKLKHILARHEQGAIHAADGYARTSGKVGVVIATSGPGATNIVTGLANAYMDSVPIVAITGQVPLGSIGKDSFQEADITGITLPITKHSFLVKSIEEIVPTIQKAFYIAGTGRPGPVIIDLPKDLTVHQAKYPPSAKMDIPGYRLQEMSGNGNLAAVAEALMQARKPVICAGGGVLKSGAEQELLAFARNLDIPVAITLMGKSSFPENHPLFLGMLGMHGTAFANYAVSESDLLIGIGMRFADRVTGNVATFAPYAKVIHIDIDAAEIDKNVATDFHIIGDAKAVLSRLLEMTRERQLPEWREKINGWKEAHPLVFERTGVLKPQFVIQQLSQVTEGKAYITTEVGQHQMWASHYYGSNIPRSFVSSGGLGTMGFGLPAAIGVQVANPDAVVFDIAGDGSIQMNIQELCTAVQYKLPINVAILNNRYLGMVRQWQELFHDCRYSHTDICCQPDFVALAKAYGCEAVRVTREEEVRPALEQAIASPRPFVIDFMVEREENVYPMVPAGGSINKMIGG